MTLGKYILEDEMPLHEARLNKVKADMRAQGEEKAVAFSQGETFHDNPAGEQVEMEQNMSSRQYRDIKLLIEGSRTLSLASLEESPIDTVSIGKKVTILIDGVEEKTLLIGGSQTPIEGRVSYDAPIVKAIMGGVVGEELEFFLRGVSKILEIKSIAQGISG